MTVSKRFKINIMGFGTLTGTYSHDWETGVTRYDVTGPRVAGTFTVQLSPHRWVKYDAPGVSPYSSTRFSRTGEEATADVLDVNADTVMVEYGHSGYTEHLRKDRPVVNGVRLVGATAVSLAKVRERSAARQRLKGRDIVCRRQVGTIHTTSVPNATADRTAVVIHGLLVHWCSRPENGDLRRAACRAEANGWRIDSAERDVKSKRDQLERARMELDRAEAYLRQLRGYADMPPVTPYAPPAETSS
ncbi:hypothetical protein [Actinomadura opuntiae]|uniref:hypothetical protein n=1 Tax=Actinomadura sp. OS1-43 TaxID=604315 RepID=UPI00255AF730|nr:hypothetical protein [Actinomadura sp. OS1-43]MDL4812788.1 hypothetical protein [Actinomadura sp. OS1-43]